MFKFFKFWDKMDLILKNLLKFLVFLTTISLFVSMYLTYIHYVPAGGSFCNVNEQINCDKVNQSLYSELFGIPVAILGMLNALFLIFSFLAILNNFDFRKIDPLITRNRFLWFLLFYVIFGFSFSAYLTYVELFILHAICVFCAINQVLTVSILGIFAAMFEEVKGRKRL